MQFGLIYEVNIPREYDWSTCIALKDLDPRQRFRHFGRGVFRRTETKSNDYGDVFQHGIVHGKWVALLTKPQFREFLRTLGFDHRHENGSAMGIPGVEPFYSTAPCLVYAVRDEQYMADVWCAPWPEIRRKTGVSDRAATWDRISSAMGCLF